jgi:hypothetical protein
LPSRARRTNITKVKFDGIATRVSAANGRDHPGMRVLLVITGFLAGTAIVLVTRLAEGSGLVVGSYKFAQEGALIVPGLLVPYALFCGWSIALRHGARPRGLALFAVGIHFGVGLLADSVAGFLLAGFVFVDGSVLLAAAGLWWGRRVETRTFLVTMAIAVAASFALIVIYHLVLAFAAGAGVAYVMRRPSRTRLVAAGLAVVAIVLAVVPVTASPAV